MTDAPLDHRLEAAERRRKISVRKARRRRWGRSAGFAVGALSTLGWAGVRLPDFGDTRAPIPSGPAKTPACARDWEPLDDANFEPTDPESTSAQADAEETTIYFRSCLSTYDFLRINSRTGSAWLLNEPRDQELHFRWDICPSPVAVQRCGS